MINEAHGDLLRDNAEALVNTVNTVGVMGKGIALQFKRAYPEMFKAYQRAAKANEIQVGRMHVWETGLLEGPRYIINFPTKRHWRSPSRMEDIEAGLQDLVKVITDLEISSIAIPPLGCGNGGLAWGDVASRIHAALEPIAENVDVRVYPPEGAPPARDMVNRTRPPRMTPTRAALLGLMETYFLLSWEWPTQLEVQKLAYFLQLAGRPMRLEYAKGLYGPYADNLRKSLRDMEGHYITGFGDESARAQSLEPIEITRLGIERAAETLEGDSEAHAAFARVATLVTGFESPYSLELLATVHWVAEHEGAKSAEEARGAIRGWTIRKANLFTEHHVNVAWEALADGGWLPEGVDASASSTEQTKIAV